MSHKRGIKLGPYTNERDRFMSKITKMLENGCWLWTASRNLKGYGTFKSYDQGKVVKAHRHAYVLFIGPITNGLHVCHRCDNPSCVNPGHLFLGTNADNVADKISKNRQAKPLLGSTHPASITNEVDVKAIRQAREQGVSRLALMEQYGLTLGCLKNILSRRTWKHVT